MELKLFQVDAFADEPFTGNPAAVCPLPSWPAAPVMQSIALENNLSETAFFVGQGAEYELRWFTPQVEVDLCGHATLATAFVLWSELGATHDVLHFKTRCGQLDVRRHGDLIALSLPIAPAHPVEAPTALKRGMGDLPEQVLAADESSTQGNYLLVYEDQGQVERLAPDFAALRELSGFGVIATAPGREHDFVSRYFASSFGIDEDPVTGSAHCTSAPYWAARLGKKRLRARQVSARGGEVNCLVLEQRVEVAGRAVLYLKGTIQVPGAG